MILLNNTPLVSIVVCSYNSERFIEETLNSIYQQVYNNIELIVTDDGSLDDTVSIIKSWINKNANRFIRTKLISVEYNTGIPSNCNRGIIEANGEWIKLIAADDILMDNCILDIITYLNNTNEKIDVLQTSSKYYLENFKNESFLYTRHIEKEPIAQTLDPKIQYLIIKWAPTINAPTIFLKRKLLLDVGLYDSKIADFEDWPMWLKISKMNVSFFSIPKVTVCYRVNSASISNTGIDEKIYSDIYVKLYRFTKVNLFDEYSLLDKFFKRYEFFIMRGIDLIGCNKKNVFNKVLYYSLIMPVIIYSRYRVTIYKTFKCL